MTDSVEDYGSSWPQQEKVTVDTLSEWVKSIAHLENRRISVLSATMSAQCKSVFHIPHVAAEPADLHDEYVEGSSR